jgi:hypothetical protein
MSRPAKVVGARERERAIFMLALPDHVQLAGKAARPSPAGRGAPPAGLLCRARALLCGSGVRCQFRPSQSLRTPEPITGSCPKHAATRFPKATVRYITGTEPRQIAPVNVVVGTLLSLFEQPGARHRVGTGRKPRGQPSRVVQDGLELGAPMPSRSITAAPDEGGRSGAPPPPLSRSITAAAG